MQVSHFADIGTPQSNINNTPVSPYESVTALRVGAQTTRLSSDKGYQNNKNLTLIQIRVQKTLHKIRKILKRTDEPIVV